MFSKTAKQLHVPDWIYMP